MQEHIESFIERVGRGEIEIYNEFSLQHELGIYLREAFKFKNTEPTKVQFERNVSFFKELHFKDLQKNNFVKKEIDISIFNEDKPHCEAIELKFPTKDECPDQMFSVCKDIMFLEQLLGAGFKRAYALVFSDFPGFYSGKCDVGTGNKIYSYFRSNGEIPLTGHIPKPKHLKDKDLHLKSTYYIKWHPIMGELKYALIEARL